MQTTASPKASTGSPLLDAPAEIRNNIYRLVVVAHDQPVDITPHDLLVRKALIDTCKQIREEAKDIIISENTFHVVCGSGDGFLAAKWIKSLCSKARMIKKLEITFKVSDITKATFLAVEAAGNGLLPRSSPGFSKAYEDMRRAHAQMGLTYGPELQALAEAVSSSIAAGNMVREALRVERISQQPSHIIDHEGFCLWFMSSLLRDLGTDKGDAAVRRRANKLAEYRALIG